MRGRTLTATDLDPEIQSLHPPGKANHHSRPAGRQASKQASKQARMINNPRWPVPADGTNRSPYLRIASGAGLRCTQRIP